MAMMLVKLIQIIWRYQAPVQQTYNSTTTPLYIELNHYIKDLFNQQ